MMMPLLLLPQDGAPGICTVTTAAVQAVLN
jgi:hypothetical protein